MKLKTIAHISAAIAIFIAFAACTDKTKTNNSTLNSQHSTPSQDSTLYGYSCDGTNDSTLVFLPMDFSDPIYYDIIDASKKGNVIGRPQIGDWVGIMLDPDDSTKASLVICLDELKGTWTYQVLPTLRQRIGAPKADHKMPADPKRDSILQTIMVPREYGFTLLRSHVAKPVGDISHASTLETDGPVEYPAVDQYSEWYIYNGQLVLGRQQTDSIPGGKTRQVTVYDTAKFVKMLPDSLVLKFKDGIKGYHRKSSATEANAAANRAAATQEQRTMERLK